MFENCFGHMAAKTEEKKINIRKSFSKKHFCQNFAVVNQKKFFNRLKNKCTNFVTPDMNEIVLFD